MNNVELSVTTENKSKKKGKYQVFILNDTVNTFSNVIESLQNICGHNYYQAGQCAYITHNVGKCSVFIDTYDECESVGEDLKLNGIQYRIEKYKPVINDKGNTKNSK